MFVQNVCLKQSKKNKKKLIKADSLNQVIDFINI